MPQTERDQHGLTGDQVRGAGFLERVRPTPPALVADLRPLRAAAVELQAGVSAWRLYEEQLRRAGADAAHRLAPAHSYRPKRSARRS